MNEEIVYRLRTIKQGTNEQANEQDPPPPEEKKSYGCMHCNTVLMIRIMIAFKLVHIL